MSNDRKTIQELKKQAEAQGWTVSYTKAGHWKWIAPDPDKGMVVCSSTPSDFYTLNLLRRDLRVRGFVEVKKQKGKRNK
jgi:hypothetical protein